MLIQLLSNGIVMGCVYALVAMGFGLIYSATGIFHFAHGIVYTSGAYLLYLLFINLKTNILTSLFLSLAGATLLGILIEVFIYSPLRKKEAAPATYIISSLGVYIFLQNLIALLFGNETKVIFPRVSKTYHFGSIILTRIQVLDAIAFVILFSIFYIFLMKTRLGKALRGLSNNALLAEVVGIDVEKTRIIAFGVGSLLAGVGAALVSLDVGIDPNMGLSIFLLAAVAVIVGGVKTFTGAALGGLFLGIIQNMVIWKTSARWQDLVTFSILIMFLLFRPQGIMGKTRRLEET
ncbi:MAG: branched-chain amino acid ABC transporter permease [bacterium]